MKKICTVLLCLFIFSGCDRAELTSEETSLLQKIGFDQQATLIVKQIVRSRFEQYETSDPGYLIENGKKTKTGVVKENGVAFPIPYRRQYDLLAAARKRLTGSGYIAFVTDLDFTENESSLVVIKSSDQFDILKYEKPAGINYGVTSADLANRLKAWDKTLRIDLIGADYDWVEFDFRQMPKDKQAFAEEIYAFCPDSIDQGVGSMEALIGEIEKKRLFLWWD